MKKITSMIISLMIISISLWSTDKAPAVDIHMAVITGNIDAINQHIKAGSDLNAKEPNRGSTPLITAIVFDKTEIAKALIKAGADLNIQNKDGSTALITASFFCRLEIVKELLAKGADKSIKNKTGGTALNAVSVPFDMVKPVFKNVEKALASFGVKFDYKYLKETRPVIAELLKK